MCLVVALAVLEVVEIRGVRRARHVLAGHADEGTGKVGIARDGGFVREDAGVEHFGYPVPGSGADTPGETQPLQVDFDAQLDAARWNLHRGREGVRLRRVRRARHHPYVPAHLLVVRYMQIVELRRVVVTHETGGLLVVSRLEFHRGDRAVAMRLLAAGDQRLPEQAADGFAAIQPQESAARAQA